MKPGYPVIAMFAGVFAFSAAIAGEDSRQLVKLPEMMQQHMMANMRDHLAAINEILAHMAKDELDKAADVAENRLGMSSLKSRPFCLPPAMSTMGRPWLRSALSKA